MINLNPSATTANPAALGGVQDAAAAGDFFAMLAGILGNATSAASPEGEGVLLPGSPLLAVDGAAADDLVADLAAGFAPLLNGELAADGAETAFPWPTVQALAAMFAQPTVVAAPDVAPTGDANAAPAVIDATAAAVAAPAASATDAAVVDAAAETALDLAEQLTAMAGTAPTDGDAAPAVTVAESPATASVVAESAEVAPTARPGMTAHATTDVRDTPADGTDASVFEAAAEADAGEPVRVESSRDADTGFRTARPGTSDNLADPLVDPLQATAELRESGAAVRDRGPMTSTAAGVARVLDAIEQLEKAPPPRQVTLELGDVRVRVAVEDGAVRMQLLGDQRDADRELLRAAEESLRERGFEMAGDGNGDARDRDADQQRPDLAPPRPEHGFGRRSRATDSTTAGVRAGIHL